MKKPPRAKGGSDRENLERQAYPAFRERDKRSTSEVSALLFRASRDNWKPSAWLDAADLCDHYRDPMGALFSVREARRAAR